MLKRFLFIFLMFVVVFVVGCGQNLENIVENSTELKISPESAELYVGQTQQFTISGMVLKSDTSYSATWEVTGGIGTIDATGLFTATETGEGTILVAIDGIRGTAEVVVSDEGGKTITGYVKDIFSNDLPVSSAVVMSGAKTIKTDINGHYELLGVSKDTESISATAANLISTTIGTDKGSVNIPLGIPSINSSYDYSQSKQVKISGRFVNKYGEPIDAYTHYSSSYPYSISETSDYLGTIFYSNGNSYLYMASDGSFSNTISLSQGKQNTNLFLSILYKKQEMTYEGYSISTKETFNSFFKEIPYNDEDSIDLGEMIVSEEVSLIHGKISYPQDNDYINVCFGLKFDNDVRVSTSNYYYRYSPFANVSDDSYSLYVPYKIKGFNWFIYAGSTLYSTNNENASKSCNSYIEKLAIINGEASCDITLPSYLKIQYPGYSEAGVSNTPKIEWESLGNEYVYMPVVYSTHYTKWFGITDKNYISFPFFPIGSGGESANLVDGNYYLALLAFKNNNFDITNFNQEDIRKYSDYSQIGGIPFTVGSTDSSISSLSSSDKSSADKYLEEFLKKLGLSIKMSKK